MSWATATGLLEGYGDGAIGPKNPVTRAQMAKFSQFLILSSNLFPLLSVRARGRCKLLQRSLATFATFQRQRSYGHAVGCAAEWGLGSFPRIAIFHRLVYNVGETSQGGDGLWRIIFAMTMDKGQVDGISALGLAHMGDGVFELLVRSWLCGHGRTKVQNLHRETVSYVSAPGSGPVCGASGAPSSAPRSTTYTARGAERPSPRHSQARHRQGIRRPPAWSASFRAPVPEGKTERINWLFVTVMEELYGI